MFPYWLLVWVWLAINLIYHSIDIRQRVGSYEITESIFPSFWRDCGKDNPVWCKIYVTSVAVNSVLKQACKEVKIF
jgi:hypothetical protein